MKRAKRTMALSAGIILGLMLTGGACSDGNKNTVQEYEEKSGYTFCGYFKDENYTQRVTGGVSKAQAHKYYAKYQPDKVQMLACAPMEVEETVYAVSFQDALIKYRRRTYDYNYLYEPMTADNYQQYATPARSKEEFFDTNQGLNKRFEMKDESLTPKLTFEDTLLVSGGKIEKIKKDNRYSAYVGDLKKTDDGFTYYIVDNAFAVILGIDGKEKIERLDFPSEIEGIRVKYISIATREEDCFPEIGTLTVPSCVEDVYIVPEKNHEIPVKKLIVEEGVRQIRLDATLARTFVLPASAYYIDFNPLHSFNPLFNQEQAIEIEGSEHYFTDGGCLYSAEGDLCYQFANRGKINCFVESRVKRVLPFSINGANKNIHIPASVEYFDFLYGMMGTRFQSAVDEAIFKHKPLLFIEGEKTTTVALKYCLLAETKMERYCTPLFKDGLLEKALQNEGAEIYKTESEKIRGSGIAGYSMFTSDENAPLKVKGSAVYSLEWSPRSGYHGEEILYTYLTEDFSKDDLDFDYVLMRYYMAQEK